MRQIRTSLLTINLDNPLVWLALSGGGCGLYLAVAWWGYGVVGFPLDDSWIHQTYARNLAETGQLAFTPGLPSTGSTAPLWSLLLSFGYISGIPLFMWSYGLGIILLGLIGWSMTRLANSMFPKQPLFGYLTGLFCLFEWHLVWAAVSGMETLLFVWLSIVLLQQYWSHQIELWSSQKTFSLGLIAGLLILTRPEGVGLVGLIGLDMLYRCWKSAKVEKFSLIKSVLTRWGGIIAGMLILITPYVLFHFYLTGKPFPSTFYAKQTEYAFILQDYPLWWRLFGNFAQPVEAVQGVFQVIFIGGQILLLPGLLMAAWLTLTERRTDLLIVWIWWIAFLWVYALRLPVTYQHGRYQMPILVWVILLGLWGSGRLLGWWSHQPFKRRPLLPLSRCGSRILSRIAAITLSGLVAGFWLLGAQAYGRDVSFIEAEMVTVARWIDSHLPSEVTVAAHDIGAIGYFSQRSLIDLAGLVTPELIPIMNDQAALLEFIEVNQADYVVTFPYWYPDMVQTPNLSAIYCTASPDFSDDCRTNMVVYRVN